MTSSILKKDMSDLFHGSMHFLNALAHCMKLVQGDAVVKALHEASGNGMGVESACMKKDEQRKLKEVAIIPHMRRRLSVFGPPHTHIRTLHTRLQTLNCS